MGLENAECQTHLPQSMRHEASQKTLKPEARNLKQIQWLKNRKNKETLLGLPSSQRALLWWLRHCMAHMQKY